MPEETPTRGKERVASPTTGVVIDIVPARGWIGVNLPEFWEYRELLWTFVVRELRLRYAQTWVGAAWVLLKPVSTMLLLWAVFGVVAPLPTDGVPHALFFFSGLVPWYFFAGAVADSQDSLIANAELLRKVYFPRPLLPLATVLARLVDVAIMLVFLGGLLVYYQVDRMPDVLGALALVLVTGLLATGLGLITAAVNVRYRDAQHVVPVALQLLMFASPVIYSSHLVPAEWRRYYLMNPLAGLIEGFRAAVLGAPLPADALAASVLATVVLLVVALVLFRRLETSFADHV